MAQTATTSTVPRFALGGLPQQVHVVGEIAATYSDGSAEVLTLCGRYFESVVSNRIGGHPRCRSCAARRH